MPVRPLTPAALAAALALAATACARKSELYCDGDTPCDRGLVCDYVGDHPASEGIGNTCVPAPLDAGPDAASDFCVAGAFIQCADAATALYCNGDGTEYVSMACDAECDASNNGCYCEPGFSVCANDVTLACDPDGVASLRSCPLGCDASGERCVDVAPSNELGDYLDQAGGALDLELSDGATIDTDTGTVVDGDGSPVAVTSFQVTAPAGGVAIRAIAVRSLTIGDATIDGARALAIMSDGDVVIRGVVVVHAGAMATGGGSCVGASSTCYVDPCPGGDLCSFVCPGAGGGGFGSLGAQGGAAVVGGFAGSRGAGGMLGGNAALEPLRGGCAGGRASLGGTPGQGGGALQIASRTLIRLDGDAAGFINAPGRGGRSSGSGGGGSGGAILLEAPRVVVPSEAGLFAHGGGGGCNNDRGEDGMASSSRAKGGVCPLSQMGSGGSGATSAEAMPGEGVSAAELTNWYFAGAGGGGAGRIRVNVPVADSFIDVGSVSPAASIGTLATR